MVKKQERAEVKASNSSNIIYYITFLGSEEKDWQENEEKERKQKAKKVNKLKEKY